MSASEVYRSVAGYTPFYFICTTDDINVACECQSLQHVTNYPNGRETFALNPRVYTRI